MILKFFGWVLLAGLTTQTFTFRTLDDKNKIRYSEVDGETLDTSIGENTGEINLCLVSRKTLHALPSYSPPDESLVAYFRNFGKEEHSMSSFRGLALELVEHYFKHYHDPPKDKDQVALINNLLEIKKKYYDKYTNSVYTGNELFVKELRETADLLTEAKRRKNKLETDKTVIHKEIKSLMLKVTLLAHEEQFKEQIKAKLNEYDEVALKITEIDFFYQNEDEYRKFRTFLYLNFTNSTPLMFHTHRMRTYFDTVERLEKLLTQVNAVLYIYESLSVYKIEVDTLYVSLTSKIEMLVGFGELISKEIDKFKKKIEKRKKIMKKKLKELLNNKLSFFKKNEKYKKYEKNLKKVVSHWRTIKRIDNELMQLESSIMGYKDTLGTTNYRFQSTRDLRNFIIPTKLKTVLALEQKNINEFLSVQSLFHMNSLFEDQEVNDIFKNSAISENAITHLTQRLKEIKEQLKVISIIENEESKIDSYLGKIFRILLTQMGEFTCFSKVEVTYIIFMMLKTNIVVDSDRFFYAFFNGMSYEKIAKFIVFNYSITMNRGFMKDFIKQVRYKADINFDHIFFSNLQDEFVQNYTRMSRLYKALTGYRVDSLDSKQEKMGFGMRLLQAVLSNYDFLWDSSTAPVKVMYLPIVIEELIGLLPWLGNIPGFRWLAAKLINMALQKLIKIILEKIPDAPSLLSTLFESLSGLSNSESDLIGLDWQNYVNDELQIDKEVELAAASVKEKISKLETVYYESLQENKFLHTRIDNYFVYKAYFDTYSLADKDNHVFKFISLFDETIHPVYRPKSETEFNINETREVMEELDEFDRSTYSNPMELFGDFNPDVYAKDKNLDNYKGYYGVPKAIVRNVQKIGKKDEQHLNELSYEDYIEIVSQEYHLAPQSDDEQQQRLPTPTFPQIFTEDPTYSGISVFNYREEPLNYSVSKKYDEVLQQIYQAPNGNEANKLVKEMIKNIIAGFGVDDRLLRNQKDEFFQNNSYSPNI